MAFLSAQRSKDPNTQVGACIVSPDQKIVGIGYNGLPWGCSDEEFSWNRTSKDPLKTKYPFVCHAEMNAIMNKNAAHLNGCIMYTVLFPCNECAKLIIQSRITHVIYASDKYAHKWEFQASRAMLEKACVTLTQYKPPRKKVVIEFHV